ncbi:hypothetical protein [Haliangium sp.]|uniref:hypothetical protein n=1 Tax=Haliangium sp. TaxID=2663208 RepID=UPI003D0A962D
MSSKCYITVTFLAGVALAVSACTLDKPADVDPAGTASISSALENGDDDFCSVENQCGIGEADCDSSDECLDGLRCSFNVGADFGFDPDVDVCTCPAEDRLGTSTFCSALCPCSQGEGDCDSDAECESGLRCFSNVGAQFGLDEDVDVCADAINGHNDNCSTSNQCGEGEGGCDDDDECSAGLTCFNDTGADFGLDPSTDMCATCAPPSRLGKHDFCSEGCECDEGEGDCDSDAECAPGLTCFNNVGADFGYADPDLDVCAACPPPSLNGGSEFCTPECPCEGGQGDCDEDEDCAGELVCRQTAGTDLCVPPDAV